MGCQTYSSLPSDTTSLPTTSTKLSCLVAGTKTWTGTATQPCADWEMNQWNHKFCTQTVVLPHTTVLWLSEFCMGQPGESVPEETFTRSHLSQSSIVPYLLHPSNMIHGIRLVQSTHLTVFIHNLSPSFLWSASWSGTLHFTLCTFLHPITVFFSQHMPIQSQAVSL